MEKISSSKLTTCLWFKNNAEQAAVFYTSISINSSICNKMYYGEEGFEQHSMPEGTVLTIEFTLENMKFTGLNGGPAFEFTPATSFMINCQGQDEVDYL